MKEKILLVDDEEGIRKVLSISLADSGYTMLTAENGDEALRIFRKEHPDIVLSDIKMPGMDGIELLKRIKRENPDTEVILITGHGDMALAIKSLKHEATDFITKPINDEELENALKKSHEKIILHRKTKEYTENLESLVHQKSEELTAAEKQIFESQMRMFDEMPCYITVYDRDFRLTASNQLFREDFGDETGSRCYNICKQAEEPCPDCPIVKTFENGKPHQAEMLLTANSGKQYNVFAWTTPLRDLSGEIGRVMLTAADMSRIVEIQDHLSSLGLMIGSVSHTIKGLLTGLDGGVYLLDSGISKNDPARISEGAETVKLMVSRIKSMVLDILFYAKEREVKKAPVSLSYFLNAVADVVESNMQRQSIEFVRDFDPFPEEFEMDEDQVHSALINILENAIDACIESPSKEPRRIIFKAREEEACITIHIRDNGIGMDEETRKKIFSLFFSSKATKGTGIGLFITNKIIGQHNGTIEVDSEPGQGTCFRIKMLKQ